MKEAISSMGIKLAYSYLNANPDKNIPKLLDWFDRIDVTNSMELQRNAVRRALEDPQGNWYQYLLGLWEGIDAGVRKTIFHNFLINSAALCFPRQDKLREKHGCNIPWAILMDPTSACNLHCTGCWAAEYGDKLSMSLETLDDIIRQGKELGVYTYLYSGGEPLVRKKDIITLCERHPDCVFAAFTNATLIDEAFADEMLRVKNFIPAISIEGFEKETDARRGEGTYRAVIRAMEILKSRKLAFGASCCYTRYNAEIIGSEEFIDDIIARGAKFTWFFTYMPVGEGAPTDLLVTAEQREYMYHQVRKFRETKPLFTLDFWNDGEYVEGCIAGGRRYLHINAAGDIEPCAFIHYSDCNIHEKTILETLKSPLFMQYRAGQPFNENHLRPCPLLDNPHRLSEMVEQSGARSTDMASPEPVRSLSAKCENAAQNWAVAADRLWAAKACGDCKGCAPQAPASVKKAASL